MLAEGRGSFQELVGIGMDMAAEVVGLIQALQDIEDLAGIAGDSSVVVGWRIQDIGKKRRVG